MTLLTPGNDEWTSLRRLPGVQEHGVIDHPVPQTFCAVKPVARHQEGRGFWMGTSRTTPAGPSCIPSEQCQIRILRTPAKKSQHVWDEGLNSGRPVHHADLNCPAHA